MILVVVVVVAGDCISLLMVWWWSGFEVVQRRCGSVFCAGSTIYELSTGVITQKLVQGAAVWNCLLYKEY